MDFNVSLVATLAPRASASAVRAHCQQRTFDLDEMNGTRIADTGVSHRSTHAGRHRFDLCQPAEALRRKRIGVGPTDRQRRARRASVFGAFEHRPMRRHAAFGAARHDQADLVGHRFRQMALEQQAQCQAGIAPREIVHQPISLGLAENCDHPVRVETAGGNQRFDAADIVGGGGGYAMDFGDRHDGYAQ